MAQSHKARPPQDPYVQRSKALTSSVQRLRGWVGSDPSRAAELADALVELTAHRLRGHSYAAAADDAQDSLRRAAQLLTATGPIGPYTAVTDATRYVTAVVHLATIQAGIGLPAAGGATIESLQPMIDQLRELGRAVPVSAETAVWALSCTARAALAAGDVATANGYADAALTRLAESGLRDDPDAAHLLLDSARLASDCRWAAGHPDEALAFLHAAQERHTAVVDGRLDQPKRLSPAVLERLAAPVFGLYSDLADRLAASGEVDLGLVNRRTLVDLLRRLAGPLGAPARIQLSMALADLADDLRAAGRLEEADAAAAEAEEMSVDRSGTEPSELQARGGPRSAPQPISWVAVAADALFAPTGAPPADLLEVVAIDAAIPVSDTRSGAPVPVDRRDPDEWLETERLEAHRRELERIEQARFEAELREAERVEAERAAAEQQAAERAEAERLESLEAERRAAAEEAERVDRKRRREERLEAHRIEVDELAEAQQAWQDARARGDRRGTRAANERVVELLRPRADDDLVRFGPELQSALEELSSARLRSGDVWGSRGPAREARALAKRLGR